MQVFALYLQFAFALSFCISLIQAQSNNYKPKRSWADSYAIDGQCYCQTTYDHSIGEVLTVRFIVKLRFLKPSSPTQNLVMLRKWVLTYFHLFYVHMNAYVYFLCSKQKQDTPIGQQTVLEICTAMGPGPDTNETTPIFNDIQCGNGPPNDAGDEDPVTGCPGLITPEIDTCTGIIGPRWNLSMLLMPNDTSAVEMNSSTEDRIEIPTAEDGIDAGNFVMARNVTMEKSKAGTDEEHIAFASADSFVEYNVSVSETGVYNLSTTVASAESGGRIVVWDDGILLNSTNVTNTGGWEKWENVSTLVNLENTTEHVRLVFAPLNNTEDSKTEYLFNLKTLYFSLVPEEDEER